MTIPRCAPSPFDPQILLATSQDAVQYKKPGLRTHWVTRRAMFVRPYCAGLL